MYIDGKSVEVLLKSIIDNNIKGYNDEMNYLINASYKNNKHKQAKEFEDINNKITYYLNTKKNYKNIVKDVSQSLLKNRIPESELYKVYYPSEIHEKNLIYPNYINNRLKEIEHCWEKKDILAQRGISYYKKVLLYGIPGTGKTQIVLNLAKKLELPLVLVRLDEVISSYLGKTGKNIKEIFSLVGSNECILFFDELDTIGKKRDDNQELGELKRVVTVFLQNMDISNIKGIIVGATNHPDMIDNALLRRFDITLEIDIPSKEERESIFFNNLDEQVKETIKKNIKIFSNLLPCSSGSYIKQISCNINRYCIINNSYDLTSIMKSFFLPIELRKTKYDKKYLKTIAEKLKNEGFSNKDISSIMSIPYTTIRGRF